jgi:hypothetical protein
MLLTFIITFLILILAILGIGIKMLIKKDGKFEKKCYIIDPKTGKKISTCIRCDKE